jgi:hypothetical protein
MSTNKQKTWLVQTGKIIVELESSGLSYDAAINLVNELTDKGYSDVRMREECPYCPTWPLEFDAERDERVQEAKQKKNEKSSD